MGLDLVFIIDVVKHGDALIATGIPQKLSLLLLLLSEQYVCVRTVLLVLFVKWLMLLLLS
jgi:hypothetical protein